MKSINTKIMGPIIAMFIVFEVLAVFLIVSLNRDLALIRDLNQIGLVEQSISAIVKLLLLISIAFFGGVTGVWLLLRKSIIRPVKELAKAAEKMSNGDVSVDVKHISHAKDEIGQLTTAFQAMTENIRAQAVIASKIADGDLSVEIMPRSGKDVGAISMQNVVKHLRTLVEEMDRLTGAAKRGRLDVRGNAQALHGGYREIILGVNETLDNIVTPLNDALLGIEQIALGEKLIIDESLYVGKFEELKDHLLLVDESVGTMLREINQLTGNAAEGNLSFRADPVKLRGNYARMVKGINLALDSVVVPLRIAAGYMERIGAGEIPTPITQTYQGEFDDIKNSINDCIRGLSALEEGNTILQRMRVNDFTKRVEGSYLGIYADIASSVNLVSDTVNELTAVIQNVASGEFEALSDQVEKKKKSEQDALTPAISDLIRSLTCVLDEVAELSSAAIQGKLQIRGDDSHLRGGYRRIVSEMNETIDAMVAPIHEASQVLQKVAEGDLHVMMHGEYLGDHSALKQSLNTTIENLRSYIEDITETLTEIGSGNLDLIVSAEYHGDFSAIKDGFGSIIYELNEVIGGINHSAELVFSGSHQVSLGSLMLSNGVTKQAAAVDELNASIAELAMQTKRNAKNANEACAFAEEAKANALDGNGKMQMMLESMQEINEASADISKIIKAIDDIAFQTNILALNAAVEAARAGQHGKGFSVVAEEVRALAERSASAARETTDRIQSSIEKAAHGTQIASDTARSLNQIVEGIEKTAEIVEEIAQESDRQAVGLSQISKGIEEVAQVVQNNSDTAEQSTRSSGTLSDQAGSLKRMVEKFALKDQVKLLHG